MPTEPNLAVWVRVYRGPSGFLPPGVYVLETCSYQQNMAKVRSCHFWGSVPRECDFCLASHLCHLLGLRLRWCRFPRNRAASSHAGLSTVAWKYVLGEGMNNCYCFVKDSFSPEGPLLGDGDRKGQVAS